MTSSEVRGGAGRAALVTGGAVRLGRAFSLALGRAGYDVAIHYNSSAGAAEETAQEIRNLGRRSYSFACDFSVAGERDFDALLDRVLKKLPNFDVLVNSASVYEQGAIKKVGAEILDRQFAVNFRAPYLMTRAFAARIGRGDVVNILDNKIAFHQYQYSAYLLSKKALADFTKLAAAEFAPEIRVNGVAPGVVMPMDSRTSDYLDWRVQGIPLGRQGSADEVTAALLYALDNRFVTGQILFADGGESLGDPGRNAGNFQDGAGP